MSFRRCIKDGELTLQILMRKVLMKDDGFILTVDSSGYHLVYHCHGEGGYRGAPYWAGCGLIVGCHDCPAMVPQAMLGMVKLAEWER